MSGMEFTTAAIKWLRKMLAVMKVVALAIGIGVAAAREWDEIRVLFWSAAIKEDAITGRLRSALLRGPRGEDESCVAGGPWDWGWGFGRVQSARVRTTRQ